MGRYHTKSQSKSRKKKKLSFGKFQLLVTFPLTLIFLGIYFVVQGLGERFQVSPVIILGVWEWMTPGEAVLFFVLFIALSLFIASSLLYFIINKWGKQL